MFIVYKSPFLKSSNPQPRVGQQYSAVGQTGFLLSDGVDLTERLRVRQSVALRGDVTDSLMLARRPRRGLDGSTGDWDSLASSSRREVNLATFSVTSHCRRSVSLSWTEGQIESELLELLQNMPIFKTLKAQRRIY